MNSRANTFGTKCGGGPWSWSPSTLGEIYQRIIDEHGQHALHKPVPGHHYRKMYTPLTDVDRPCFRRLPANIIVTSPARLYRSSGWKYKGLVYLDCECHWDFQYSYPWDKGTLKDWMPVSLLSTCYIPEILTTTPLADFAFYGRNKPQINQPVQLSLFA